MKTTSTLLAGATCVIAALVVAALPASAETAQVSEVVQDVSISGSQASVGDSLSESKSLRTGTKSRAELTFEDSTLLRVGSNSVFSFLGNKGKAREFELTQGTAFVATPTTHGGVNVRCGGVTATIEGCLVTLGITPNGIFIGVAHETGDEGGGGVTFGGHTYGTNEAGFIPFGADRKTLDFSKATYFAYDGAAQLSTGFVSQNLPPELKEIAKNAKIQTFRTNKANNSPNVAPDESFLDIIDIATDMRDMRDMPPPTVDCDRECFVEQIN